MGSSYRDHQAGTPWTRPQLASAMDAYRAGASIREIAEEAGVSARSLYSALERVGHKLEGHSSSREPMPLEVRRAWSKRARKAWVLRDTDGLTWAQAAERVGWHGSPDSLRMAVLRWRRDVGVTTTAGHGVESMRRVRAGAARGREAMARRAAGGEG